MSDDDFDIFGASSRRLPARPLPQQLRCLPSEPLAGDGEYDFIATKKPIVKKPAKNKVKQTTQRKKGQNTRKNTEEESEESDELEAPTPPSPALSPVSKMLLDMDKNKAAELNSLPVSRRTRSSLGSSNPAAEIGKKKPEQKVVAKTPPPPSTKRGRKPRGAAKATATSAAIMENFLARVNDAANSAPENLSDFIAHVNQAAPQKNRRRAVAEAAPQKNPRRAAAQAAPPNDRRRALAEIAARAPVCDSIDLISAVVPRIEGFVNLDSDEEKEVQPSVQSQKPVALSADFDIDNPVIDINLSWLGEMQSYKLRAHQKFSHLLKEISEKNSVPLEEVAVNLDNHFIEPNESPHIIGLKVYHILSGRAMKSNHKALPKDDFNAMSLVQKPRKFQLKVQADRWKKPLIMPMKKTETFKILYIKCAEELNCNVQELKLFFDGELLELDDTPKNQDMEGNEMIDLRLKS